MERIRTGPNSTLLWKSRDTVDNDTLPSTETVPLDPARGLQADGLEGEHPNQPTHSVDTGETTGINLRRTPPSPDVINVVWRCSRKTSDEKWVVFASIPMSPVIENRVSLVPWATSYVPIRLVVILH